jgi:hypothetical protein
MLQCVSYISSNTVFINILSSITQNETGYVAALLKAKTLERRHWGYIHWFVNYRVVSNQLDAFTALELELELRCLSPTRMSV